MNRSVSALTFVLSFCVLGQVPAVNSGTATYPTSGTICTSTVGGCAPLASPAFTGTPTAPTPAASDNSTTIPTTAYVTTAITNAVTAAAGRDLVAAATAAVLPNTPTFTHVDSGIGSFFTSSTNSVLVVDGYTPLLSDRILVKNQATAANNGIYSVTQLGVASVTPWIMTRTLDYDQASDMNNTIVPVANHGTVNALTSWIMTSIVATVDTDAVTFAAFTPAGANIVTAVSPGVGLCHFAGSTQTCTSSAVALGSADVSGVLLGANGGTGVANTGFTITLAGNLTTTGAFNTTFAAGGTATMTLPTTSQTIPGMNQVNTAGSSMTWDLTSASSTVGLKVPAAAGAVPTVDGAVAENTTNHTHVWGSNGTTMVGAIAATGTGTATTCTNQFVTVVSSLAVPTCATVALNTATSGILTGANGGTGVANTGFTITLAGNLSTTGAFNTTFAQGGTATMTLPTTSQTIPGMNQTNTAGSSMVWDLSAASTTAGFKIPAAAGAVPTADDFLAMNTTNHTFVWGSNGTTEVGAVAATGTGTATTCSNQFVRAVSSLVAPTCATIALADTPLTTRGDLLVANSTPALARLALGAANTVLHGSSTDPSYSAVVGGDFGSSITARAVLNNATAAAAAPTFSTTADTLAYQVAEIPTQLEVCSAGGTGCASGAFTTSGVGTALEAITGLSWTFPANTALNVPFECHIIYHQNSATANVNFGFQDATVAPTNLAVQGLFNTSATTSTQQNLVGSSTTTATNIFAAATPSAITTNWNVDFWGYIEQPSNASSSAFTIRTSTATAADTVTIVRGSYCHVGI